MDSFLIVTTCTLMLTDLFERYLYHSDVGNSDSRRHNQRISGEDFRVPASCLTPGTDKARLVWSRSFDEQSTVAQAVCSNKSPQSSAYPTLIPL